MAVPSGTVAMSNIQSEFGDSYNINNYYRGGSYVTNHPVNAGIPTSGTISMLQFRGASYIWYVSMTVGGTTDFNMHSYMTANYGNSNGPIYATLTLNTSTALYATSTSSWGFTTGSGWPSGSSLTFNMNGGSYVLGMGGNGGAGNSFYKGSAVVDGSPGGPAIYLSYPLTINNSGAGILGGGGGGGGGAIEYVPGFPYYSAGGGGGGAFYWYATYGVNAAGGGGGGGGTSNQGNSGGTGGDGGDRHSGAGTPGGNGVANGGAGGARGDWYSGGESPYDLYAGYGGAGGGWGTAGSAGTGSTYNNAFYTYRSGANGGAAGYAIQENGYTLSGSTGTTAGPIG